MPTKNANGTSARSKARQSRVTATSTKRISNPSPTAPAPGKLLIIPMSAIVISPINYRKYYDPVQLAEFAAGIKALGIISPITVREIDPDKYQLVAGERRYYGARMAELIEIPAVIRELTDEEVEEIQLQENVQREDPHAMHEAIAIRRMYDRSLTTEEIAARLGKSVNWVYRREKLSRLIPDIQEMFLATIFTFLQAGDISELPEDIQQRFFDNHCKTWKEKKVTFNNLPGLLSGFRYGLSSAIFDISDPTLDPKQGACNGCQWNSAFGGLLLPVEGALGHCNLKACFDGKKRTHLQRIITSAITTEQVVSIITYGELSADIKAIIDAVPGSSDLPLVQEEKVTLIKTPVAPDKEDYTYFDYPKGDNEQNEDEEGLEENENYEEKVELLKEDEYSEAMKVYDSEVAAYNTEINNGKALKGLHVFYGRISIRYYYPTPSSRSSSGNTYTKSADVDALIRANMDTPVILQNEIARLVKREARNKEIDKDKIQKAVHQSLISSINAENAANTLTGEDKFAIIYLAYQTLTYRNVNAVKAKLKLNFDHRAKAEEIYKAFSKLSTESIAYLVRSALAGDSTSTSPGSTTGYFLRRVAEAAGVDTATIEKKQEETAKARQGRQSQKIGRYKKRLKTLNSRASKSDKKHASQPEVTEEALAEDE